MSFLSELWINLISVVKTMKYTDVIDIAIVAYLIYKVIALMRETRAAQLAKGIIFLALSYFFAVQLNLNTLGFLLQYLFQFGIYAILIVFQPELRRALEQVGRTKIGVFGRLGGLSSDSGGYIQKTKDLIDVIVKATSLLSRQKVGALIVIERNTRLGDIIDSGTIIDSEPSTNILRNIFFPNSPLHDGAVIIRNYRVYAAGCVLPLTENADISKALGTRHRAALGASENSDAVVVVVSEQTGIISASENGNLQRNFSQESLNQFLEEELLSSIYEEASSKKSRFFKGRVK